MEEFHIALISDRTPHDVSRWQALRNQINELEEVE